MGFFILGKTAFNTLSAHLSVYLFGGHSEIKIRSTDFAIIHYYSIFYTFLTCSNQSLRRRAPKYENRFK